MAKKPNTPTGSSSAPLLLVGAGLVIIVGILIWQFLSSTVPLSSPSSGSPTADLSIPYSNVPRVSLADAKAAFDQKSAVFVDVRDADSYHAGHIPGALNIPLSEFDASYSQLDPNQWIITYCT